MNPWILAALFGLGYHAGKAEVQRFERLAAEEIASKLDGDDRHVHVQTKLNGLIGGAMGDLKQVTIRASNFSTAELPLYTEPDRPRSGHIRELRLFLDDFRLAGLRVEHLEASIPDCRYDFGLAQRHHTVRLSQSGVGTGLVRIRAPDLEAYILRKFKEIKRVSVRIEKDKVFVEGYGEFIVVHTNFEVIATLESPDGSRLMLANAVIFFDGRRADASSGKVLLDTLNPVVDLAKDLGLADAVHVEKIRLKDGFLEASGATKIPLRPGDRYP
ncbi:MAG: hypothetical protein M9921_03595 [Fimbriimonadaceae bacterium]|nr:hypothetical protein [Fimbriimonadaceae bacterium]